MRPLAWQLDAASYDFHYELTPQIGHLDTIRHVNNVAVHGFHCEARARYHMMLWGPHAWFSDDVLLRPRRTVTHFVAETHYPDRVVCAVKLVRLNTDSYRLALGLFQNGQCTGVQECLMGAWQDDRWIALPAPIRRALAARVSEDVVLAQLSDAPGGAVDLNRFPRQTELTGRYADLDPDRRLGELAIARYAEQARAGSLAAARRPGIGLLVARVDVGYDRWDTGLGAIDLLSGLASTGTKSFRMQAGVVVDNARIAVCESVMVLMDRVAHRPMPIGESLREAMAPLAIGSDRAAPGLGSP